MASRKISNLLALAVLSLLSERPMHPYEIAAVMRQRGLADSVKLNTGSLYSVIEALLRKQLIQPMETQREGRHPERTVYTVTEQGKVEFLHWLRSLIRTPMKEYSQFAAGLAFLGHLAPSEAVTLLEERANLLADEIRGRHTAMASASKMVDPLFLIEDEYTLILLESELAWLRQLIQAISDGTFTESVGDRTVWKITYPDPMAGRDENGTKTD